MSLFRRVLQPSLGFLIPFGTACARFNYNPTMAFASLTLNVLIASPSDLVDERKVAQAAIHDWNDLHAEAERVTLLPRTWETSTTPASGGSPQTFVNRQIVDQA